MPTFRLWPDLDHHLKATFPNTNAIGQSLFSTGHSSDAGRHSLRNMSYRPEAGDEDTKNYPRNESREHELYSTLASQRYTRNPSRPAQGVW